MSEHEGFIQLTNYKDHPTNNLYKVFFFHDEERAEYFENLLTEQKIPFEKGTEDMSDGRIFHLYGINKGYLDQAHKANFLTNGHFRKPFMGKSKLKYLLSVVVVGLIILAIVRALSN